MEESPTLGTGSQPLYTPLSGQNLEEQILKRIGVDLLPEPLKEYLARPTLEAEKMRLELMERLESVKGIDILVQSVQKELTSVAAKITAIARMARKGEFKTRSYPQYSFTCPICYKSASFRVKEMSDFLKDLHFKSAQMCRFDDKDFENSENFAREIEKLIIGVDLETKRPASL